MTDDATQELAPAIEAASLILMREQAGGPPEILVVRRHRGLAFAGGAYAFPGGRVDPADRAEAVDALPALDAADGASRIAALRETREETGIVVADHPQTLIPFARWLPMHEHLVRRFDTRFYLARCEDGAEPVADGSETTHAFWATAEDVLARCRAGDGRAIFPTRRLLERLASFASFAEARAQAERLPQQIISPWIEQRDGKDWLCIPGDAGYPTTAEQIATASRN